MHWRGYRDPAGAHWWIVNKTLLKLCFRAKPFFISGCKNAYFCPVGSEGEERYMRLQIGATQWRQTRNDGLLGCAKTMFIITYMETITCRIQLEIVPACSTIDCTGVPRFQHDPACDHRWVFKKCPQYFEHGCSWAGGMLMRLREQWAEVLLTVFLMYFIFLLVFCEKWNTI